MKSRSTLLYLVFLLSLSNFVFSNDKICPPPINDLCSGAIDLGLLECGFYAQYDEDLEATPDPEATGNCIDNTGLGQWYTFTTPDPIPYNSIYVASPWIDFEIFSTTTDCSALVYEGCGTGPYSFEPEAGTRYYYLTTGGFHMTLFFAGQSSCVDPLVSFNSCSGPIHSASYTDCAWPNAEIPCPNDHVIWFDYIAGNSGSDVIISVDDFTGAQGNTADEISISVFSDDCSTLLFGYDAAGFGYVCSAMQGGQSITLEDLPPGYQIKIAISSGLNSAGHFDLFIEAVDEGFVSNDRCDDAEEIFEGLNSILSNVCATEDFPVDDCPPRGEATVWYEYDPGSIPQDIEITLHMTGITSPAISVYDECWGNLLESVCGTTLELFCIDYPIFIQIGSSDEDVGNFNLEIESMPSISSLEPIVTGSPICSNSEAGIFISIPSGEIVNILVEISSLSSSYITGMNTQSFIGVNSATIKDSLINTSSLPEEAVYTITIENFGNICPTDPVDFSILVYPEFKITEVTIEECVPYLLELDAFEIIEGGTVPYLGILWFWNNSGLVGTTNNLSLEVVESGEIILKITDFVGCRKEVKIIVDMTIPIDPTFDFELSYCRTDQDSIGFPETSLEGIEGTWSPSSIDLEIYTEDDYYEILFTPNEEYCSNPVSDSIEIYSGAIPEFNLPDVLCPSDDLYIFPMMDLNGLYGDWEIPTLDLTSFTGILNNTFSHSHEGCYAVFDYEFVVEPEIVLNFEIPDSMCRADAAIILNIIGNGGHVGSWDVPIIDPGLVSSNSITSIWIPNEGQSSCPKDTTIIIQIIDIVTPEFSLPNELCTSETAYTFPTIDNQSINGTWSISTIDPAESTGNIQSIFTSDEYCVEAFIWEIQIVEPIIPEFNLDVELCSLDDILTLPLVSDNGIPGTWTQSFIDPSIDDGQIMIEFQANSTEFCIENIDLIFEIIQADDPVFDLPTILCWTDEDLLLPIVSTNGIEGIWTPSIIDINSNLGAMINSTFLPTDGSCANEDILNFEILSPFVVDAIGTDPSDCSIEDGSILLDVIQGSNLEFSIDGGIFWQSSTLFSSLGSGGYTVLVRSADLTYCQHSIETFLSSPDLPVINDVFTFDISSCVIENGSIIIDAVGNDLEYSIDGGVTWQTSNEFNNLSEGEYMINIRESMSDCVVDVSAMIMDFPQTELLEVNTQDLSDCNVYDGQIEIFAEGEALAYSIDNGVSWSSQNTFDNLPSGTFMILVQSTTGSDCIVSSSVTLSEPSAPNLINLDIQNPTLCVPSTGIINVEAEGNNLEYSIDGGLTWQNSNVFSGLVSNLYTIIVRDSDRINCTAKEEVTVFLEDENLPESTINITPPSECDFKDARLEISNVTDGVEYSLDGGMSWQTDNIFIHLTAGIYEVITRKISFPECLIIQSIEIPNTACPCNDLLLEFITSNISCTGEDLALVELTSILGMNDSDIDIKWQNGETGQSIEVTTEGWHLVTIQYDDDCIWIDAVWVDIIKPIQFEVIVQDLDCPDANNGLLEVFNVTGGSGDYEYSIDGTTYQEEYIFSDLVASEYEVYVRDTTNCLTITKIDVFANDKIEIILPEIEIIFIGESIVLDPGIDQSQIDFFSWSPDYEILNTNDLIITVSPNISTIYTLNIFYGVCTDSKDIMINVKAKEDIHVGNVFSPNGDNHNGHVYLQGIPNSTIELNNFKVYDRWGNEVFNVTAPQFNNKADGWDGYYRGKLASSGVYVYMINYIQDGESQVKVGTVTLIY